jgi:hypothetical protein
MNSKSHCKTVKIIQADVDFILLVIFFAVPKSPVLLNPVSARDLPLLAAIVLLGIEMV